MTDRAFDLALAGLLAALALLNFVRAFAGWRRGRADWYAGRGLEFSGDREGDPVGFATAIWGNVAAGLFALGIAAALALRPGPGGEAENLRSALDCAKGAPFQASAGNCGRDASAPRLDR